MSEDNERPEIKFAEDGEFAIARDKYAIENASKRHPVESIEPPIELMDYDKGYKDACKRYPYVLNAAIALIIQSENPKTACYQVAFALGLGLCAGKSMEEIATSLGVTRASISKGAKQFIEALNLPPSTYMKSTIACLSYSEARIESIKKNNPKE